MAELSPLRRRMIEDMTIRNMSPATQRSYISAVSKFSRYFGRSPERLELEDVRAFQVHLVSTGISWASLNQIVCALRFFYGITLGEAEVPERIAYDGRLADRAAWRLGRPTPRAAHRLAIRRRSRALVAGGDIGDAPSGRHGSGIRAGLENLFGRNRTDCAASAAPMAGTGRHRRRAAQRQRPALRAALAQCVLRGRRRGEPAGGDTPDIGGVDRIGMHFGAGGALVCAARPRPQRPLERKQPAVWLRAHHHRGGHRHRGCGLGASGERGCAKSRAPRQSHELQRIDAPLLRVGGECGRLGGPGVFRGAAGNHAQGTWVQFDLHINAGAVAAAKFLAFGCPHTIAVAAWLAEQAVGRPVIGALPESVQALSEHFAVPVEKLGRLLIVEDAWLAAALRPLSIAIEHPQSRR